MPSTQNQNPKYIDHPVDTRLKLAGLWTSTTLCYLYCDYLTLYAPGKLAGMLQGQMGPMGTVTPGALLGTSVLMAIPCTMVVFSLVAPLAWNRWVNVIAGVLFTAIMALLVPRVRPYYQLWACLEMLLTLAIVVFALRWPKVPLPVDRG